MDIIATATKIGEYLVPFFLKSKTITQIGKDIGEATDNELGLLWKKVKPWFIEEYKEDTAIDDTFEKDDVKNVIKKGLKNADDDTINIITELLKKLEQQPSTTNKINITGNNNIVNQGVTNSNIQISTGSGDNIQGDKKVYNIDKIDKANFS